MSSMTAEIDALLAAIAARVDECRAASATAAEGDPDALGALGEEVDAIASDVAKLKALVTSPTLGGAG